MAIRLNNDVLRLDRHWSHPDGETLASLLGGTDRPGDDSIVAVPALQQHGDVSPRQSRSRLLRDWFGPCRRERLQASSGSTSSAETGPRRPAPTTGAPRLPGRPAVRVVSPAAHPRSESGRAGPGSPRWLPTTTPTTRPTADRFAATALEVGDDAALTVQIRSLMWWSRSGAASTYRLHRRRAQPGGALTHPLRRRRPVRGHRCGHGGTCPFTVMSHGPHRG